MRAGDAQVEGAAGGLLIPRPVERRPPPTTRAVRFVFTATPIHDRLVHVTGGQTLATFHGQPGGEWDTLRNWPIRERQRLTSAGWMSRYGWKPDRFADILTGNGAPEHDPIEWFLREARLAVFERRNAHDTDIRLSTARRRGHRSYYAYRTALVRAAGHPSLYAYRQAMGWQ